MKAHENRHITHSYTSLAPSTAGTGHSTCCFGSLQRDPHSGTRGQPWVRHTKEQQQVSLAEKELFKKNEKCRREVRVSDASLAAVAEDIFARAALEVLPALVCKNLCYVHVLR